MFEAASRVYRETRKKHDYLFNVYVMRPLAAVAVLPVARTRITPNQVTLMNLAVFVVAAAGFAAWTSWGGGVAAVLVLEASYGLDCLDGMLARHKKVASTVGHLFDFFTDELKAILLAGALAVRAWRVGGFGLDGRWWPAGDARFLLAGVVGVVAVSSALSLTRFLRSPEVSGRPTSVEAFYETADMRVPSALMGRIAASVATFLRFVNHYPSHIWLWALAGHTELFMWVWIALNGLYVLRGWLGLAVRFGRG
ncbi:MAG: CDP-alcohol phosphatidyltransferase family protein [Polyangiaceae bacterium]|jgi:phosphatidylglycerophosphate synthase